MDNEIAALEEQNQALENQMALPKTATDPAELLKLSREQEKNAARLEELYAQWEELAGDE